MPSDVASVLIIPPAPKVHPKDLPGWRAVRDFTRNSVSAWPDRAFELPIYARRIFGITGVLVNDPEGTRHVLTTNAANYVRAVPFIRFFRPLVGNGVLLAEGAAWKAQRRLLAPVFTPASVGRLLPHFQVAADAFVEDLTGRQEVNLSVALQNATIDAALRALFTLPDHGLRHRLAAMVPGYVSGPGAPNLLDGFARTEHSWPWLQRRRTAYLRPWFDAIDDMIAERRRRGPTDHPIDLLDLLLAARDPETGTALDDADIRDQCSTMLAAGFETTARLLFWACYLLSLDTTEQERVRAEVIAAPLGQTPSMDDLRRWPAVREVLLETLRLYPPAPLMVRQAVARDTILGIDVKPGTLVYISPWLIGRHRKYWDQSAAFVPSRFRDKPMPWTSGTFMPFGGGPRICIGAAFAMAEAEIMLAALLSRYRISLADTKPVLPVGRGFLMPSYAPLFRLKPARLRR
jgi:cytochrome P450